MFDDEEYEQDDEMAPEEESFPVDEDNSPGHEKSLSELRQKSGSGSKKDGDNLRNTIDKNKTKNAGSNVAKNAARNKNNDEQSSEDNPEGEKKSSKEEMTQDAASDAAKTAASAAMQAAGVPKGIADKVSQKVVDSEQGQKLINDTIKKVKNQKKTMIIKLLIPAIPYVLGLFVVVFAVLMVMTQMMAIVEKVEGAFITVSTGAEKFINFASGNGWNTEEEEFFITLKDQYKLSLGYTEKGIDIPLVAATIHYNRGIDPEIYENDESGSTDTSIGEDADTEQLFGNFLQGELAKNFYYVANDKLGSLTDFSPGKRRLIGHMVDITFTNYKTNDIGEAIEGWKNFLAFYGQSASDDLLQTFNIFSWINKARTIGAYETQASESDSYAGYYIRNILYESQEFNKTFNETYGENNEKVSDETGEGIFSFPIINMKYNEDKYYEYLTNVYIPGTYFSNHELTDNEKYEVEKIAREIFEQRDSYNYLVDRTVEDGQLSNCKYTYSSSEATTASLQGYAVDVDFVNNLNVELLPGSCGSKVSNCTDSDISDVLSLKEYVIGVAYSEIGASLGDNEEWLKANMVAIKSYTLNKNKSTLRLEGSNYYIKMINNTYQQTYCSVEDGCMDRTSNRKPPLSEEAKTYLRKVYDSIATTFLYTKGGAFIGSYRANYSMCVSSGISGSCMGQNDSEDDAAAGLNYQNILGKYYTQDIGLIDVSKGTMLAPVYQCYSSGLAAGNHGNMMIRTSAPVSTDKYFNQPYVSNSNRGQCVWYVKGRASEIVATSVTDPIVQDKLLNVLRNATGNGNQWYNATLQSVFGSSSDYTKPKTGSIGVYDWTQNRCVSYWKNKGQNGCKEKYGHAIIIEEVNETNGTVTYTDGYTSTGSCPSNWNCVKYTLHKDVPISRLSNLGGEYIFIGYIYLLD